MINLFNYIDRPSVIHKLTGATKLVCMLLWCLAAMTSFYTPLLIGLSVAGLLLFKLSKIKFSDIWFMLAATIAFMVLNNVMIYLFSPEHGTTIYGTRTILFKIAGPYTVTAEQLFYHLNVILKYAASIPVILLFICTTNPSEFAASLNRIGVSYRISYAVALALRYIPDIQREYRDISLAQQARGTEMSKKASLIDRLKAVSTILVPLVLSSVERIETISNAMELRGFGKGKKRSWYSARKFSGMDIVFIVISAVLMVISLLLTYRNGGRYFNPFI
ncbi:MAG: energy-coupling factor transporter transmembrane protein EcfT [Oscillospiraceae bacterium]|nr:energy-coupling factor transporter transmembrane protein EcfT [Oscillospiraceae bacterium]